MKTAKSNSTPNKLHLAIDISKDWSDAALESTDGGYRLFRFRHVYEDVSTVISKLKGINLPIVVGFEATGDYHRVVVEQFFRAGFELVLLSSVSAARYREASYGTTDKNDRKDSIVLLEMMKHGMTQRYIEPSHSQVHNYRELSNIYHQVVRNRTQAQHQLLTHFLPLYFPELLKFWHSSRALWMISLLQHYPTPSHICQDSREQFLETCLSFFKRSKSVQISKFDEIYCTAKKSLGLSVSADSVAIEMFQMHLKNLKNLEQRRAALERRAAKLLDSHPDFKILTSLPGIGIIHALSIIAEAGDLRRFAHHRQFLRYCGFDLKKHQSGYYKGKESLSKRGNAMLRKTFWMAACSAIRQPENAFREKYARYVAKNSNDPHIKRKALTAVAVKMARVAYGLVKTNATYHPYYEKQITSGMTSLNTFHRGTLVTS